MKSSVNILANSSKPTKAKAKDKPKGKSTGMMGMPSSDRETMSIRKIENGFIVRHSCDTKDGYQETEWYTDKKPEIGMPKGK